MSDAMDLARRAVACPRWRWMPGMLAASGIRCVAEDESWSHPPDASGVSDSGGTWSGASSNCRLYLPDLTDPATMGCLLALVREAWRHVGVLAVSIEPDDRMEPDNGDVVVWAWYGNARTEQIAVGPIAGALVAALEAAP